jgi:hypothetical protein
MQRIVKIVLILALLSWAAIGLRHARGQRSNESIPANAFVATSSSRTHEDIAVYADDRSFVLKNLTLARMTGSTVLKGEIVNNESRDREQVSFEVRAYNRGGQLLTGPERETIFTAGRLKANTSAPINHDYGVWLQGVHLDDIARIEVSETGAEPRTSTLARMIPLASHALTWKRYSEIEE